MVRINHFSRKYLIKLCIIVLFLFILGIYIFNINKSKTSNLNILANAPIYKMQKNVEHRFASLKNKGKLERIFKTDQQNIYYKKNKWHGRVRFGGISYQALFTIDTSMVHYSLSGNNIEGLNFKIFNPKNAKLTYLIGLKYKGKSKIVFRKSFESQKLFTGDMKFSKPISGEFEISFISKGRGLGAWINPRLVKSKKKPNIVIVIVMDTLRYDHTSIFGYHRKTTPYLEKLAKDSILYKNAFSTTSWTLPAHVSLFSGKNLTEHGVIAPTDKISLTYPLLAEVFQKNGFVTAAFTGGGFVEDSYGFHRGFQYYSNIPGNVFSMKSAERVFSHFKNYINRYSGNDMFIFLHTYQIHAPYKAPRKYINRIKKNVKGNLIGISKFIKDKKNYFMPVKDEQKQLMIDLYDASILYTDEALIGNVINYLKEKGYYDNATIAVLSDHGEEFYDHGSWEHGHTVYSELTKIPLIIKFPFTNKTKKNIIDNDLVSISDIAGIILKSSKLEKYIDVNFKVRQKNKNYLITVLLPVSPIIPQFSPKISFIKDNLHFIYNKIDKNSNNYFSPSPIKKKHELFNFSNDLKEKINIFNKNSPIFKYFNNIVKKYLLKLEKIKKYDNQKIDKNLEKRLKSLGYLGN